MPDLVKAVCWSLGKRVTNKVGGFQQADVAGPGQGTGTRARLPWGEAQRQGSNKELSIGGSKTTRMSYF